MEASAHSARALAPVWGRLNAENALRALDYIQLEFSDCKQPRFCWAQIGFRLIKTRFGERRLKPNRWLIMTLEISLKF